MGLSGGCCAICGRPASQVHHRKRRSQGGPDIPENLLPVDDACHGRIHRRDVAFSHAMGWLLHAWDDITPWWDLPFWTDRERAA